MAWARPCRPARRGGAGRGLSVSPAAAGRVAFVLKGYPRLSETFIAQEIFGLEQRGLEILVVALRRPTDRAVHPVHRRIRARVLYLPEYLYREPPGLAGLAPGAALAGLPPHPARLA